MSLKLAMKMQGGKIKQQGRCATRVECVIRKRLKLLEKAYLLCIILS